MYWETVPNWVLIIYYIFILVSLGAALLNIIRFRTVVLSTVTLILALTIPIISIINSIGREIGVDEFEHFIAQLQQGAPWSIYVLLGYGFLVVWWVIYFIQRFNKRRGRSSGTSNGDI